MPGALREVSPARPIDPSPERMAPGQRPDPMRLLYDHQVFSLQNAGGASRYFFELTRFFAAEPEVQTEVWLGMNGTVYPFTDLDGQKVHVRQLPGWLPPGKPRYLVNELWSRAKALIAPTVDIYHPT